MLMILLESCAGTARTFLSTLVYLILPDFFEKQISEGHAFIPPGDGLCDKLPHDGIALFVCA